MRWSLLLLAATCITTCGRPAEEGPAAGLRVLFLGEPGTERCTDFRRYLEARFASVRVADRWTHDEAALRAADVVVLDWPQQDGVSKWMLAGDKTAPARSPLGSREAWTLPTLLLGSAGLNVAWAWDVKGGFG